MKILLAAACAAFLSTPAFALNPGTVSFLGELGISPQSPEVLAVAKDSILKNKVPVTLDSLAAKRDETGVRAFIATRSFIKAYRKSSRVEFPEGELYNYTYLTAEEQDFIKKALRGDFPPPSVMQA